MERLTQNNFDYCLEMCEPECMHECPFYKDDQESKCHTAAMYDKLREYEDTGLIPKEVREKLSKLTRYEDLFDQRPYFRWREIAEAEDDGRIAILPCKVGDTVYAISTYRYSNIVSVSEVSVEAVTLWDDRITVRYTRNISRIDDHGVWGKSVFSTREEAESAMKGMSEDA